MAGDITFWGCPSVRPIFVSTISQGRFEGISSNLNSNRGFFSTTMRMTFVVLSQISQRLLDGFASDIHLSLKMNCKNHPLIILLVPLVFTSNNYISILYNSSYNRIRVKMGTYSKCLLMIFELDWRSFDTTHFDQYLVGTEYQ